MTTKSLNWNSIGFLFCLFALAVAYAFIASSPANAQTDDLDAPAVIGAPIALGFADGTPPPPPRRGRFGDEGQRPPRPGREIMQELRERNPELFEQARERIGNGEHPRDVMPQLLRKFHQEGSDDDRAWMQEKRGQFRGMMQERGIGEGRRGPAARDAERGPRGPEGEMRGRGPQGFECPHCHRAIDRPGAGPQGRRGFGPMNERGRGFQDDAPRGPRGPMMDGRGFGEGRRGEGPQGLGRGQGEGRRGMGPRDFERGPRGPEFRGQGAGRLDSLEHIEAQIERLERRLQDLREQTKE